ncbi:MAG: DMT family transporter [Tissierellaceae bacterium]|nr:DMT family transporter [Tissierellaceae bacterium]
MEKVYVGIFYSLLAGMIVATQNVFSARVSEKLGMWETTFVVHIIGLIFALIMVRLFGEGNLRNISEVNKVYLLGGVLGVLIIFTVANGVSLLGASFSIALMVIAQLFFATVIDTLGLFGAEKIPFDFTKLIGLVIMAVGVIVYNSKG